MAALNVEDIDYQIKLLALMVIQPSFLREYRNSVNPAWFEEELADICKGIVNYFDKYNAAPTFSDLTIYLKQFVARTVEEADSFETIVKGLRAWGEQGSLTFVYDHFKEFVTHKAYKEALLAGITALEEHRYDLVPELMRKAEQATAARDKIFDFYKDIPDLLKRKIVRNVIPTGIKSLDDSMGGGPARTELSVVLAPTRLGKTTFLVNVGFAALRRGYSVAHFFVEQTQELVAARYASRLLRQPYVKLSADPADAAKRIAKYQQKGGKLLICNCSRWKIKAVRAFLYEHYENPPDVIIVDYADELVSIEHYTDRRHEIASIYTELIAVAGEFNAAMWTASQTNRAALGKQNIRLEDIAESIEKANKADNVFALCQTEQEFKLNDLRIFTAKVRNEESQHEIACKVFRDSQQIVDKSAWMRKQNP